MTSRRRLAALLTCFVVAGVAYAAPPASARTTEPGAHGRATSRPGGSTAPAPLIDHGGRVLASSKTYAIYWGTWADPAADADLQKGMAALLGGFEGSAYLNTATQYMRGAAATHTQYMGAYVDPSAPPSRGPSTTAIANEVAKVLTANHLATDPNAIYLVYTSNLPKVNYCAWHSFGTVNGVSTQVAYLPFTASSCYPTSDPYSSNAWKFSTKALADSTAHEFMEAITDPQTSSATYAWIDKNGAEIGDKCNYVYSATVTLAPVTGVPSNTWQIQSEWSNAINGCAQTT